MISKLFSPPTVARQAAKDLAHAQRELLQAEAAHEHWKHHSAMLRERIERLQGIVESAQ